MTILETSDGEFDNSLGKLEKALIEELEKELKPENTYRLDQSQNPDTRLFGRLVFKRLEALNRLYLPADVDPQASIFED